MGARSVSRVMIAAGAVAMVLVASGHAAVLCAKPKKYGTFNASVKVREVCKPNEVQLAPEQVGVCCTTTTTTSTSTTRTTSTSTSTTTTLPTRCCAVSSETACADIPNATATNDCNSLGGTLASAGLFCNGATGQCEESETGAGNCCDGFGGSSRCVEGAFTQTACGSPAVFWPSSVCLPNGGCSVCCDGTQTGTSDICLVSAISASRCRAAGATVGAPGSVCDANGDCVSPPGTPGDCCQVTARPSSPSGPYSYCYMQTPGVDCSAGQDEYFG